MNIPSRFIINTTISRRVFIILVILCKIGLIVPIDVRISSFYIREYRRILHSRFHNVLKMIQKKVLLLSLHVWIFPVCVHFCWGVYHFKNTYSPITLANISSIKLVRCSSSPNNPVYPSRVDFSDLVFSLSSYRHWYIGLVFNSRFLDSW
jgi:hypothetical protein